MLTYLPQANSGGVADRSILMKRWSISPYTWMAVRILYWGKLKLSWDDDYLYSHCSSQAASAVDDEHTLHWKFWFNEVSEEHHMIAIAWSWTLRWHGTCADSLIDWWCFLLRFIFFVFSVQLGEDKELTVTWLRWTRPLPSLEESELGAWWVGCLFRPYLHVSFLRLNLRGLSELLW